MPKNIDLSSDSSGSDQKYVKPGKSKKFVNIVNNQIYGKKIKVLNVKDNKQRAKMVVSSSPSDASPIKETVQTSASSKTHKNKGRQPVKATARITQFESNVNQLIVVPPTVNFTCTYCGEESVINVHPKKWDENSEDVYHSCTFLNPYPEYIIPGENKRQKDSKSSTFTLSKTNAGLEEVSKEPTKRSSDKLVNPNGSRTGFLKEPKVCRGPEESVNGWSKYKYPKVDINLTSSAQEQHQKRREASCAARKGVSKTFSRSKEEEKEEKKIQIIVPIKKGKQVSLCHTYLYRNLTSSIIERVKL